MLFRLTTEYLSLSVYSCPEYLEVAIGALLRALAPTHWVEPSLPNGLEMALAHWLDADSLAPTLSQLDLISDWLPGLCGQDVPTAS